MSRKGKVSDIRLNSSKSNKKYNSDGSINTNKLTQSQLDRYNRKKDEEQHRRDEESRPPRIGRRGHEK